MGQQQAAMIRQQQQQLANRQTAPNAASPQPAQFTPEMTAALDEAKKTQSKLMNNVVQQSAEPSPVQAKSNVAPPDKSPSKASKKKLAATEMATTPASATSDLVETPVASPSTSKKTSKANRAQTLAKEESPSTPKPRSPRRPSRRNAPTAMDEEEG